MSDEIDSLYGVPLDEFTKARNALAASLRKAGNADAAERVKKLAKPSVAVWTVNQLARHDRLRMRALLQAGERLRAAQAGVLEGKSPDAVREATDAQRKAVDALLEGARTLLADAGRSATDQTLERIGRTLAAASVDEDARTALEEGRLTEELEPRGFEALAGMLVAPSPVRRKGRTADDGAKRRREAERKDRLAEARKRVRELERDLAQKRAAAASAERALRKAEQELEALEAN